MAAEAAHASTQLQQAFRLAAAELGMASAGWLFVQAAAEEGGAGAVAALRDELGRGWPVLDAICAGWNAGARPSAADAPGQVEPLREALRGASRVVVVGLEARGLDSLLAAVDAGTRVALLRHSDLSPDWDRVLGNYGGRLEMLELADFQRWAGPQAVTLTWCYGQRDGQPFVLPSWLRVAGADVRLQFRDLLGVRMLDLPLQVYPRWLVAADAALFTALVERGT